MPIILKKDIKEKIQTDLSSGDFDSLLKHFHAFGSSLQKEFKLSIKACTDIEIKSWIRKKASLGREPIDINKIKNFLYFSTAWEDDGLERGNSETSENKEGIKRQENKYKKDISKADRRAIHLALLYYETAIKNLIEGDSKNLLSEEEQELILKKIQKAGKSIADFKRPPHKFLQGLCIFNAFLAGLACGAMTGGCIFLFLSGLGVVLPIAIPIAIVIFAAGFRANFRYFSKHVTDFWLNATRRGLSEIIGNNGKRISLSRPKKLLFLPAAFVSLAVGVSVCAFTFMTGLKIMAFFFPLLAVTCPPLAPIIVGIFGVMLAIAMTTLMFKAFVGVIQKPFSFIEAFKKISNAIKELSFAKFLGNIIKASMLGFAIFGLYFLCFAGIPTLAIVFGPIAAYIVGWSAFIGQIPFLLKTTNAFCDGVAEFVVNSGRAVVQLFQRTNKTPGSSEPSSRTNRFIQFFKQTSEFLALLINALGNGVLVVGKPLISYAAGVACFFNSAASNLIKQDMSALKIREEADKQAIGKLFREAISIQKDSFTENQKVQNTAMNGKAEGPTRYNLVENRAGRRSSEFFIPEKQASNPTGFLSSSLPLKA